MAHVCMWVPRSHSNASICESPRSHPNAPICESPVYVQSRLHVSPLFTFKRAYMWVPRSHPNAPTCESPVHIQTRLHVSPPFTSKRAYMWAQRRLWSHAVSNPSPAGCMQIGHPLAMLQWKVAPRESLGLAVCMVTGRVTFSITETLVLVRNDKMSSSRYVRLCACKIPT